MLKKRTSLNIKQLLEPSVRLDDGLKTIKEHKAALSPELSGYLSVKAHEFISINDLEIAEKLYRWAVAIGITIGSQKAVAYCSYDLAELLENMNKPSQSVEFYRKAFPFYFKNRDVKEIYRIFHRIATCFAKANQVSRAIDELKKADETLTSIGLKYNSKLNLYPFLIEWLEEQNRVEEAKDAKKILSEAQQRLNRIETLRPKFEKALTIGPKGNVNEALKLYKESYDPFMENCDLADRINLLLNMGATLSDAAEYNEATRVLKKAVQICKSIGDIQREASVRKNLASNYEDCGRYQDALEEYRLALNLYGKVGDDKAIGRTMNDLGVINKNLNLYIDSLRYYIAARKVFRDHNESDSLRGLMANIDTIFGKLRLQISHDIATKVIDYFQRGELVEAAKLIEVGISPWESDYQDTFDLNVDASELPENLLMQQPGGGDGLLSLGRRYLASGEILKGVQEIWAAATTFQTLDCNCERAIELYYEAGNICEANGLNHDLIQISQQLGGCLAKIGRFQEAREVLEETIEEALNRDFFPVLWKARTELSDIYIKLNEPHKAINQFAFAAEEIENRARDFKHVRTAEGFLSDKIIVFQRYVNLLIKFQNRQSAYEIVLKAKSWPFVNFSEPIKKSKSKTPSNKLRNEIKQAKQKIEKFIRGDPDPKKIEKANWIFGCEELRIWAEECEKTWNLPEVQKFNGFFKQTVLKPIDPKSAIVDFFFTEEALYIFTITHERISHYEVDISQDKIFQRLSETGFFNNTLDRRKLSAVPDILDFLKELLGAYFVNLYKSRNITQFCVCPHGILHILPVAANIVAEIPSIEITAWNVPHASFFNSLEDIPDAESFRYMGVGVTDGLENVEEEIFEAGKYFNKKNRTTIIDEKISRDRILTKMQNADVIHFACHGVLRSDISELSFLHLGPNERLRSIDILTRAHIKAKLVVLSACWTSIGRVTPSDEIGSLSRSFLYTGAEVVMATLWPIPDEGAKEFINDFFRLWLKDKIPLKKAFCRAQKLHINNPLVWSAFVLLEAK